MNVKNNVYMLLLGKHVTLTKKIYCVHTSPPEKIQIQIRGCIKSLPPPTSKVKWSPPPKKKHTTRCLSSSLMNHLPILATLARALRNNRNPALFIIMLTVKKDNKKLKNILKINIIDIFFLKYIYYINIFFL